MHQNLFSGANTAKSKVSSGTDGTLCRMCTCFTLPCGVVENEDYRNCETGFLYLSKQRTSGNSNGLFFIWITISFYKLAGPQ